MEVKDNRPSKKPNKLVSIYGENNGSYFQTLCQVQRGRHQVHHHPPRWSASRLRSTSRVLHPSPRWSAVQLRNISRVLHHPSPRWSTVGLIRCGVSRVLHHPSPRLSAAQLHHNHPTSRVRSANRSHRLPP